MMAIGHNKSPKTQIQTQQKGKRQEKKLSKKPTTQNKTIKKTEMAIGHKVYPPKSTDIIRKKLSYFDTMGTLTIRLGR